MPRFEQLTDAPDWSANTRRTYRAALRYWVAWHEFRFGTRLAIALDPPEPVSSEVINQFIEDHMPRRADGRVVPSMALNAPTRPLSPLLSLAASPPPGTTATRARALVAIQAKRFGPLGRVSIERKLAELASAWACENAGRSSVVPPISPDRLVERLLAACRRSRCGRLDAVLVILAQQLLPHQIVALNVADLGEISGLPAYSADTSPVYIVMKEPRGLVQRATPVLEFHGHEARILRAWHAERVQELAGDDAPFACAARKRRMCVGSVSQRIRSLANAAGLVSGSGGISITATTLTKSAWSAAHRHHPLFKTARQAGLQADDIVRRYLRRRD